MSDKKPVKRDGKKKKVVQAQVAGPPEKKKESATPVTLYLKHDCEHAFQDATYGRGIRLFNRAGRLKSSRQYRCTVCMGKVER